ncbi:MAG: hypothetical protein AB7T38_08150 [Nitrospirales bacterium]
MHKGPALAGVHMPPNLLVCGHIPEKLRARYTRELCPRRSLDLHISLLFFHIHPDRGRMPL